MSDQPRFCDTGKSEPCPPQRQNCDHAGVQDVEQDESRGLTGDPKHGYYHGVDGYERRRETQNSECPTCIGAVLSAENGDECERSGQEQSGASGEDDGAQSDACPTEQSAERLVRVCTLGEQRLDWAMANEAEFSKFTSMKAR